MKQEEKQIHVENPETFTGLEVSKIKDWAAGLPGVYNASKHVFSEAGVLRGLKALSALNQKGGIDCPSCAWPDPDDERSGIAEYCENGAKAIAEEATVKKLTSRFFEENSVYDLSALSDFEIGRKGRIAQPMYLPKNASHYEPISWENAFKKIGARLNELSSPDEAIFYTSGRASNEAAFLYQLFVREYGTNNLPDCSNMCHESSGVALSETLGIGKGSVTLEDFYHAEVIIILGQNPGTNHPRMLSALQKAKANGAIIIAVNPLPEVGLMAFSNPQTLKGLLGISDRLCDLYAPIKINADLPFIQAVELLLLEEDKKTKKVFDHDFIREKTENYSLWEEALLKKSLPELARQCGIDIEKIQETADILKNKNKIIACWAMGLTQHVNSVDTIKEVVNLLLLKGSIGKQGAGTCPVRGHSNVQGDRTMGIYEKPPRQLLDAIENVFGFKPPQKHGYDSVNAIKAMHEKKASVFIALGGNFLSASPDTLYTAKALQNCKLTVHVSTKLNRSHLVHGEEALILPCLGRTDRDVINGEDQFVSCENSMGVVQMSKGSLTPVSKDMLSEPAIVVGMAKATLPHSKVDWNKYLTHYDEIRSDIEKTIEGFDNYNERAREKGGFYLPNCAREQTFNTSSKKAQFSVCSFTSPALAEDEILMMTIRAHDQFNTTIYGLDDRYRGIYNERRVILMNEKDMQKHKLRANDIVDLYNYHGGVERVARRFIALPYPIPESCAATYFPEANTLVPIDSVAEKSNTPTSKSIVLKIKKQA